MKTQTVASSRKKVRRPPFRGLKRLLRGIQLRLYVFCHKSRREPYPLYADQAPRRRPRGLQARIVSFLAALALLTCLAMVISYVNWHSIGWAIFHGLLNWFYVIYYVLRYGWN